jgi:hypothetical protein
MFTKREEVVPEGYLRRLTVERIPHVLGRIIEFQSNLFYDTRYVSPFFIALAYSGLGNQSQALAWLHRA